MHRFVLLPALLVPLLLNGARGDLILGFDGITANSTADVAIGEAQLKVTVIDVGPGQVDFVFTNSGPLASSITDVYFDDGTLLGIATITNGAGVSFSQGGAPANLPGGNAADPDFEAIAAFGADSNPPAQPNGVNPGETLTIRFNLQAGGTYDTVVSELISGELRIGIHVQGFDGGGSESFVNTPHVPIPEPGTLLLVGVGLVVLGSARQLGRKR